MTFTWPEALLGLLLVPVLAAVYWWVQTRRRRHTLRYSSVALVKGAAISSSRIRRHGPAVLYVLGVAALVLALARPQASFATTESNGTVILVLDISRSMANGDIPPSRIDAAEAALSEFVDRQPKGVKIGLVAFAASAQLVTPPTHNRADILNALRFLALQRGTNIADGLQAAFEAISESQTGLYPDATFRPGSVEMPLQIPDPAAATIILLSDGASTEGRPPIEVAVEIGRAGIKTFTVGLGTSQGLSVLGPASNMQLDEGVLRGIASATGGQYYSAANAGQLREVYGELARKSGFVQKQTELTFLATGVAMLFMVAGAGLGMLWSSKLP